MIFHDTISFEFNVGDKFKVIQNNNVVYEDVICTITNNSDNFPISLSYSDESFTIRGFYLVSEDFGLRTSSHILGRLYKDLFCANITRIIPL